MNSPDEKRESEGLSPASTAAGGSRFSLFISGEWRAQRRIWLALSIPAIVVIALSALLFPRVPESARDATSCVTGSLLLLLGTALVVLLGAKSFAVRRNDPSALLSRNTLFWSKLAFNFALMLPILVIFCAAVAWVTSPRALGLDQGPAHYLSYHGDQPVSWSSARELLFIFSLAALGFLSAAAVGASFRSGLLAPIVASVIGGGLSLYWMLITTRVWVHAAWSWSFSSTSSHLTPLASLISGISLFLAVILVSAWRCWKGASGQRLARLSRFAAACAAVAVIPCIPTAVLCAWVMLRATPADYARHYQSIYLAPSSAGRFVLLECYSSAHMRPDEEYGDRRVAIVDADSGRSRWLDRMHASSFPYGFYELTWEGRIASNIWSPDGRRCILQHEGCLAIPVLFTIRSGRSSQWLFDAETQKLSPLADLGIEFVEDDYAGWLDNSTLYGKDVPETFFNIDTGRKSKCHSPAELDAPVFYISGGTPSNGVIPIAGHGAYYWRFASSTREGPGSLYIGRYSPDLPVAEYVILSHPWLAPEVADISPDGGWALIRGSSAKAPSDEDWDKANYVFYLASLESGLITEVAPAENMPIVGLWETDLPLFLHGGRRFALEMGRRLFVYDMESKIWTVFAAPEGPPRDRNWRPSPPTLSPNRKYAALMTENRMGLVTVDLDTGAQKPLASLDKAMFFRPIWLGNDRLIVASHAVIERYADRIRFGPPEYYIINRDGTGKRSLLEGFEAESLIPDSR